MANQNTSQQSPLLVYGQLGAIVSAIVVSLGSHNVNTDPYARPDPWTGTDQKGFSNVIDVRFLAITEELTECRKRHDANDARWIEHNKWGLQIAGENKIELDFLQRDVQKLQDQVFDLYTSETKD